MDEKTQENTEGKAAEEAASKAAASGTNDPQDGTTSEGKKEIKTTPLIDIANQAAARMEKANEETGRLLKRNEELEQRQALGSSAGGRVEAKQISKEDVKKEGAKEFFKGTALEQAIDKL